MQSTNLSAYISWDAKSLSIGQSKHLVVIQHAVQVLNPLWVHIPIKDDPLSLVELTTHIVNDPGRRTTTNKASIYQKIQHRQAATSGKCNTIACKLLASCIVHVAQNTNQTYIYK